MKIKIKISFLVLILIILYHICSAQKNIIIPQLGITQHLHNKAFGLSVGFGYHYNINVKHSLGVLLNYSYVESRGILPKNLNVSNVILRDYTYIPSLPNFGWDAQSFPKNSLKTKPNNYFNLNLSLSYLYSIIASKNSLLKIGIGGVLTYRDEKILTELVEAKIFQSPLQSDVNNLKIPIFQYNTYYDIGLSPSLYYHYSITPKLILGCGSNLFLFTEPQSAFFTITPFLGIKF